MLMDKKCLYTTLQIRRKAIADSDNSSSEIEMLSAPQVNSQYRNCITIPRAVAKVVPRKSRSKSMGYNTNTLPRVKNSVEEHITHTYREQLQTRLLNEELSLKVSHESHSALRLKSDCLTDILSALVAFLQTLDMKTMAHKRLHNLLISAGSSTLGNSKSDGSNSNYNLSHKNSDKNSPKPNFDEFKKCLTEACRMATEGTGKDMMGDVEVYKSRHKDFLKATSNLLSLVNPGGKISNKHLKDLESQYDEIKEKYDQAKRVLDLKLHSSIDKKVETIAKSVDKLKPLLSGSLDQQLLNSLSQFDGKSLKIRGDGKKSSNSQIK